MTFDPPKFLLKHEMVEPGIEFANFGGCGGDIHGFLTTTQHHLLKKKKVKVTVMLPLL